MKRIIVKSFIMFFTIALLIIPVGQAAAVNVFQGCGQLPNAQNSTVCKDNATQSGKKTNLFIVIIRDVINVLSYVAGAAAVIIIIVSAIRFVTAGGDTKVVSEARSGLIAAAAGILIMVMGQTLVAFVLNRIH